MERGGRGPRPCTRRNRAVGTGAKLASEGGGSKAGPGGCLLFWTRKAPFLNLECENLVPRPERILGDPAGDRKGTRDRRRATGSLPGSWLLARPDVESAWCSIPAVVPRHLLLHWSKSLWLGVGGELSPHWGLFC